MGIWEHEGILPVGSRDGRGFVPGVQTPPLGTRVPRAEGKPKPGEGGPSTRALELEGQASASTAFAQPSHGAHGLHGRRVTAPKPSSPSLLESGVQVHAPLRQGPGSLRSGLPAQPPCCPHTPFLTWPRLHLRRVFGQGSSAGNTYTTHLL